MFVIKPEYKGTKVFLRELGLKIEAVDANAQMLISNGYDYMVEAKRTHVIEEQPKELTEEPQSKPKRKTKKRKTNDD